MIRHLTIALLVTCAAFALRADAAEPDSPRAYVTRGMDRFRAADIPGSLADFDKAAELAPQVAPHLWQRGISQYYAGQFDAGRKQFESHKAVNPHDVENAAWHYLCVARAESVDAARKALIEIDTRNDRRVPMAQVYELYAGRGSEQDVLQAAEQADTAEARMYAHLYLGLYHEAAGGADKAKAHLLQSAAANLTGHYMHDVAKVHVKLRGW